MSKLIEGQIEATSIDFDLPELEPLHRVETRAQVISTWGPSGSPGKTVLAINIAFELALAGHRVLLIDLDTVAPSIETQLNLVDHPAGLAAACRLAAQDRLTESELLRLSQPIQVSGNTLHVMTGLSTPSRWPEVTFEKVNSLIDIASSNFDFVILDIASGLASATQQPISGIERNTATLAALQNSNCIAAIGLSDPVGVRRFILGIQELKSLRLDADAIVVMNRVRSSAIGRKPKVQIAETLARFASIEVDAFVPDDPATFDQCALESIPLITAKRKSAARIAINQLVKRKILAESNSLDDRVAKLN